MGRVTNRTVTTLLHNQPIRKPFSSFSRGLKDIVFKISPTDCFAFVSESNPKSSRGKLAMIALPLLLSFPLSRACVSRLGPFRRYRGLKKRFQETLDCDTKALTGILNVMLHHQ